MFLYFVSQIFNYHLLLQCKIDYTVIADLEVRHPVYILGSACAEREVAVEAEHQQPHGRTAVEHCRGQCDLDGDYYDMASIMV
jgi:hypothetical protein